jgi:predicted permease
LHEQYRRILNIAEGDARMNTLLQDLRYGLRQLKSHPTFALTAILSLALGIGATVSVFSIIYAVLINPFPYANANRICWTRLRTKAETFGYALDGEQIQRLGQSPVIEYVMGYDTSHMSINDNGIPYDAMSLQMTGQGFQLLGMSPLMGRYFTPADTPFGKSPAPVVVLSYKFWMRHFSGDPSVLGKVIHLNRKPYQIIGVMPQNFGWFAADVYEPVSLTDDPKQNLGVVLKLKPGVSAIAGEQALQPLFQQFAKAFPKDYPGGGFRVTLITLINDIQKSMRQTLYLLFGAVLLLLLIGCANVSILLLARGIARRHELAVRTAVGASGKRLVRQLLTESLLIAFTGAILGVVLAYSTLHLIVARLPYLAFPNEANFHVHVPVLLFSVGVAVLTGILFGLFPALMLRRPDVNAVMQSTSRRIAGSVSGKVMHHGLIAAQIALTLLLLSSAGMAITGFVSTMRIPLGYNPHNVMSVAIPLHRNTYTSWAGRRQYFEELRDSITQLPQVNAAALGFPTNPPYSGLITSYQLRGKTSAANQQITVQFVGTRYFSTLEIPLRQGRLWSNDELSRGAPLVIVNQAFVKQCFSNGQVLGHSIKIRLPKNNPPFLFTSPGTDGWMQIIGVVGNERNNGLDKPVKPAAYLPYSALLAGFTRIFLRSKVNPLLLERSVRRQIAKVDPQQQAVFGRGSLLEQSLHNQPLWARGRLITMLFSVFSVLALLLAAVGVYSVVSYSVAQRTNEFGIRIALGASRSNVVKLVFFSVGISLGIGVALGLALSLSLDKWIAHWVTDTGHHILLSFAGSAVMLAVAAIACLAPARKASSVDPAAALRTE